MWVNLKKDTEQIPAKLGKIKILPKVDSRKGQKVKQQGKARLSANLSGELLLFP